MSTLTNKAAARRYFEEAPYHPEVCDEIFAPRLVFHAIQYGSNSPQTIQSDPQQEKAVYAWLASVWSPGWQMTIDQVIAEDNKVMVQWTFHGVQQDEYCGLPATHKAVVYSGINIFRFEAGKILEIWDLTDRLWLWQQLGILPDIEAAIRAMRKNL